MASDPIEAQFFSQRNKDLLQKALTDDFSRRGVFMNGQQQTRLSKTLQHYMDEIYEVNGSQSINFLNKEVVSSTVTDFASYIRRQDVQSVNLSQTAPPALTPGQAPLRLTEDTGASFERMQNERVQARPMPKNIPDFRVSLEDDNSVSAVSLFERIQKQREDEAAAQAAAVASSQTQAQPMNRYMNAADSYASGFAQKNTAIDNALVERNINRLVNGLPSFPVLPQEFMPQQQLVVTERTQPNANPTIALPNAVRTREALPQDTLIRQPDILSYKETEYNLFINSADRDWVNNKNDTRYQFVVNFSPANNRQGYGLSPAAQVKFKNISRIELVKAIVPAEGLDILLRKKASGTTDPNNTDAVINALSFPYISVRVTEFDNNNYGTNNVIDNTFGVLQYDANWVSESIDVRNDLTLSRGYLAMIPKFMKSQKVYTPTPLASLNKMTITFQRPDGTVLSPNTDAINIQGIIPSERINTGSNNLYLFGNSNITTQAVYTTSTSNDSQYYWITTSSWFPRHLFNEGDRINIGGLDLSGLIGKSNNENTVSVTAPAVNEFTTYLTQSSGLLISGVGYYTSNGTSSNTFISGGYQSSGITTCANSLGYANCLIVQAKYNDPTTGLTTVRPFGGSTTGNVALGQALVGGSNGPLFVTSNARLINMSHQTQLVFRIITREMDSTSMVRPDNL